MFLLFGALCSLILGVVDVFLFNREKKVKNIIHILAADIFLPNLFALFFQKSAAKDVSLFAAKQQIPDFNLRYVIAAVIFTVIAVIIRAFLTGVLYYEPDPPKKPKKALAISIVSAAVFFFGAAAYTGTLWGKATFGDITADQILINLKSPTEGTSSEIILSIFDGPLLTTAFLTALHCLFAFSSRKLTYSLTEKKINLLPAFSKRIICLITAALMLIGGVSFGINSFNLHKLYIAFMKTSPYIEEHFANPDATPMKFPEKKRNLIHIYLESVENTFFSKELGGALNDNLMPDLEKLSKEGYSFSHLPEGFGGPFPSTGSQWSVASMVNMGTGLPMKTPTGPNDYGTKGVFLPGATALGDILKDNGYEQSLMFGAKAAFGGLDVYYKSHGDFNILDYSAVKNKGWIDDDYFVWWGFEDDKLYEFAKRELTRLYETGKPFNFTMETADTHCPDGYLSPNAPSPYKSQYANCILYSQSETVKFVRWLELQPFYENTTVVIIGDHLTMAADFINKNVDADYTRTTFNLILNPAPEIGNIPEERTHNRKWAAFDMFPTILASLGVKIEGDRLAIGTNLFSDRKTLFEEEGVDKVNSALEKRSDFYEKNILSAPDGEGS